jgi:hypothetical protein
MRLIGMMPVRNEAWCLGLSARVALMWCDALIVYMHACTDNTLGIVADLIHENPGRVIARTERNSEWHEMFQRQHMLEIARGAGATHLAIIDADEILTGIVCPYVEDSYFADGSGDSKPSIRRFVEDIPHGSIFQLPGYNLRGSLNRYHSNGIWGNRWFSLAFADAEGLHWSGDRFHQREPMGRPLVNYRPIQQGQGGILHLWGCSERRITAKHALYKVNERLRWPNKPIAEIERMYNLWRSPADSAVEYPYQTDWAKPWTFADVPASWWEPYAHLMKYLDVDAEPWQEKAVRDAVTEHSAETFRGLDLFGVA